MAQMGGRSLRYTGELIYKSPVNQPIDSHEHMNAYDKIQTNDAKYKIQDNLGGKEAWSTFVQDLSQSRRFL